MLRRLGFREVGVYERHARLDGAWRDVVIVEALLGDAAGATVARELPAGDRAGLAAALATAGLPATDLAAPTCASGSSPIAAARSSAMPGSRPRAATRCSAPSSWSVRAARAPDGRSSTRPPAGRLAGRRTPVAAHHHGAGILRASRLRPHRPRRRPAGDRRDQRVRHSMPG
jgi:hypothetical protein